MTHTNTNPIAVIEQALEAVRPADSLSDARLRLAKRELATITAGQGAATTQAAQDVLKERQRQVSAEGWTPEHDDSHGFGQMAYAASSYARHAGFSMETGKWMVAQPREWPWAPSWWKPKDPPRRNLVKAGALILAEIERLDRATNPQPTEPAPSTAGEREAYDDKCCVGMKPSRVMQRAFSMCPTEMPHVDRMAWMADYFMRNCKTAALLQSTADHIPDALAGKVVGSNAKS